MSDEHEPLSLKSKHLWEVARASANPAMWAMLDDLEMLQAERAKLMQQVKELLEWQKTATRDLKLVIDANHSQQRVIQNERENADKLRSRIADLEAKLAEREAYEVVDTIETEWGYQLACVTEHPDGEITLQTTGYSIADPDQQFSIRMPKQYRICRTQSEASDE
jgi:seryl-tRNA synthetase